MLRGGVELAPRRHRHKKIPTEDTQNPTERLVIREVSATIEITHGTLAIGPCSGRYDWVSWRGVGWALGNRVSGNTIGQAIRRGGQKLPWQLDPANLARLVTASPFPAVICTLYYYFTVHPHPTLSPASSTQRHFPGTTPSALVARWSPCSR